MPEPDPQQEMREALEQLSRHLADALRPVFEEWRRLVQHLYDALGGAEGIAALKAELERAQLERTRWETQHPGLRYGEPCHCLCRARGHDGRLCAVEPVVTFEVRVYDGRPVRVPLCEPCAELNGVAAASEEPST